MPTAQRRGPTATAQRGTGPGVHPPNPGAEDSRPSPPRRSRDHHARARPPVSFPFRRAPEGKGTRPEATLPDFLPRVGAPPNPGPLSLSVLTSGWARGREELPHGPCCRPTRPAPARLPAARAAGRARSRAARASVLPAGCSGRAARARGRHLLGSREQRCLQVHQVLVGKNCRVP